MTTRTVVAYDFSPCSEAALAYAVSRQAPSGEVCLVHVHPPITSQFSIELTAMSPAFADADATIGQAASRELEAVASRFGETEPGVTFKVIVVPGHAPDAIVEVARTEKAGEIVVGSHGRRGIKRFLLGSVAERVVRLADRTVTVVKIPQAAGDADTGS